MEKYVRIGFVFAGILAWVVLAAFLGTVFQWISPNLDKPLLGAQFAVSDLLGMLIGMALAAVLWFNPVVNRLGLEVAAELRNVTWPTWPETRVSTIVVVVVTVVVSLILGFFDAISGYLTGFIYRL